MSRTFLVALCSCFLLLSTLLLLQAPSGAQATLGLDLSVYQGEVSQASWTCLHQKGYRFAIIQAWLSSGKANPYVSTDIARAKAAGFQYVDIYVFPDFAKGIASAGSQIKSAVAAARAGGQNFGMAWIDIEAAQLWGKCADNLAFLRAMLAAGEQMGLHMGIYSSQYQWQSIMCSSSEFSHYQLWYPHYDYNPSFSDWRAFSGWTKPAIKQFSDTTSVCGTQIDQNFY